MKFPFLRSDPAEFFLELKSFSFGGGRSNTPPNNVAIKNNNLYTLLRTHDFENVSQRIKTNVHISF